MKTISKILFYVLVSSLFTIKAFSETLVIENKAKFLKVSKKKVENDFLKMSSMKSWIYGDDVAKMCAFLVSNDSERISGQVIGVNGNELRLD